MILLTNWTKEISYVIFLLVWRHNHLQKLLQSYKIFSGSSLMDDNLDPTLLLKSQPVKICGTLGDLVSFVQFKKCEKHPWRSVTFSKVAWFSLQLY